MGRCLRCKPVEGYQIRPAAVQSPFAFPQGPIAVGRDIIVDDDDDNMSGITMDPALRAESVRWRPDAIAIMGELAEEEEDFADFPPPARIRRPEPSVCPEDDFNPLPERPRPQQSGVWMDSIGNLDPPEQRPGVPVRPQRPMHDSFPSGQYPKRRSDMMAPPPTPPTSKKPSDAPSRRLSPIRNNIIPTRLPSEIEEESSGQRLSSTSSGLQESGPSIPYPKPVTASNGAEPNGYSENLPDYDDEEEKNEIQAPDSSFRGDPWRNQDPNFIMNASRNSRKERRHQQRSSAEIGEICFVPDDLGPTDGHGSVRQGLSADSSRHRKPPLSSSPPDLQFIPDSEEHVTPRKTRNHLPAHIRQQGRGTPSPPLALQPTSRGGRRTPSPPLTLQATTRPGQGPAASDFVDGPPPFDPTGSGINTIPGIIRQLVSRGSDAKIRGKAFRSLADLIWRNGDEAKLMVARNNGIESVVECMWEDLANPSVQAAAVDLLFALSACSEDDMGRDIFMGGSAGKAIDALLISMQTHISVESLQRSGCGALGCLASASKENEQVDDGTLSGAVSCVVAAMDAHRKSTEVQKWGLWALYCQCVLSHNAENSQMNLAKGATEAGGMNVICRAMDLNDYDMLVLEWGCKLYWSLSFSDEICGMLTESNKTILVMIKVLRTYQGNPEAEAMEEAAYGALANLSRIKKTHSWLRESGVIARVFDSMDTFHSVEGLNTEACALLANLAGSQPLKEAVLTYGVEKIHTAMEKFSDSVELHREALRALLCLSVDSEDAKSKLSTEGSLNLILDAVARHQRSPLLLETGFALVSSICAGKSTGSVDLSDVVDLLIEAMRKFPSERKLQETVCLLLRNLSCRDQELVVESADFFSSLLNVMKSQADSDIVQLNLCCVITNLLAGEPGITCSKVDDGMNQIVTVIQSHMESASVLEMACAAVWQLISSSDGCKESFIGTGGVEYVKTVLLMHPDSPNTLEKACGILACLSGSPSHAQLVTENQGITYVVESMRTHSTSLALLEPASVILRNAVLNSVDNAPEASGGISTIVAALKDNAGATAFESEGCSALWVMAAHSEDCRQKILALDGLAVLMELMDNDDAEGDVRDAARGAFNQLAIPCSN